MSKVYAVSGLYEDKYKFIEKIFGNQKKAEEYRDELVEEEIQATEMANKCKKCDGNNKDCPFYLEPTYEENGCDCYMPYHNEVVYIIEELDYEE